MASIPEYEALRLKDMVLVKNSLNRVLLLARGHVKTREDKVAFATVVRLMKLHEDEISEMMAEQGDDTVH